MSDWPFRFVHAADLHLEQPPYGMLEVPDHLREPFLESPLLAAERVFDTVLAEEAEFLVLSGDVFDPRQTGPRGLLFLAEQFSRLAEKGIPVYWAGGRVDTSDDWPTFFRLPENVHVFGEGEPEELIHRRDATALARLVGRSRTRNDGDTIRPSDFPSDPAGLFSIAVAHGRSEADLLKKSPIDYWALGSGHARATMFSSPGMAHDPGSPQGRCAKEAGSHGCTVVHVTPPRHARTTFVATDVLRWQDEQIPFDAATTVEQLKGLLRDRAKNMKQQASTHLLIRWTLTGSGPLLLKLRRGTLARTLLDDLRADFGFGSSVAWSTSLSVEPEGALPAEWSEEESILGDFLREVRHYETNPSESLGLASYLSEGHLVNALGSAVEIPDPQERGRVLREVALLGMDLLSGEEPQS